MDNDLLRRLMHTFVEELNEHVVALNNGLLALEKGTTPQERAQPFKALFHAAHSLKGAAGSVNVDLIKNACHHVETLLIAVREERLKLTPELLALLFKTVDAIEEAGMQLRDEQDLSGSPLERLLAELAHAAAPPAEAKSKPAVASPPETAKRNPAPVQESKTPAPPKRTAAPTSTAPLTTPKPSPKATLPATSPVGAAVSASGTTTVASVRVPAEKLDSLLAQSGELLVAQRRIKLYVERLIEWKSQWRGVERPGAQRLTPLGQPGTKPRRQSGAREESSDPFRKFDKDIDKLNDAVRKLDQSWRELDESVRRVRMLPFAEACGGLERAARDLARASDKQVHLVIQGENVEIDRSVLEGLKDPLLHLVRNAVDHGLEPAAERRAAGKPEVGTITVAAALRGGQVEISVSDDGRGLNLEKIREKVQQKDLPEPQNDSELARMIFLPGLSTASIITDVSGRGVGLDVVLSRIESLHGSVDLAFEPQQGTRLTLTVPLTLTKIRTVRLRAGRQTLSVATASVQQLVRFSPEDVRQVSGRDMLLLGEAPLPIASLAETLGLPEQDASEVSQLANDKLHGVILAAGDQRVVFLVDEVQEEQEVVVKSLGSRIRRVRHVAAATLLSEGQVALVLNVSQLVRTALHRASAKAVRSRVATEVQEKKRLLVVEDSLTTRTLIKSILETAGYEVQVAVDGQQAWEALPDANVDLVVSDVDMPHMDGFALTEAIRGSKRFADLPVVLVTARQTDEDQARGIRVGASAYLVKSGFDQRNLLETITQLVQGRAAMLRVLIVDDSPTARQLLTEILSADPGIEVVGTARNGREGVEKTLDLRPDLVTMDVVMPVMDGIAATQEIMTVAPTPIVLVSASTLVGEVDTAMQALRAGALTLLFKPLGPGTPNFEKCARELVDTIKAMAEVKVVGRRQRPTRTTAPAAPTAKRPAVAGGIVAIATSTGGPPALAKILSGLPPDFPLPILIVQHIAAGFTEGLVAWLNSITKLEVKIARAGDALVGGQVFIAPEGLHLGVANRHKILLSAEPPIDGFRPSANYLFHSVGRVFADSTIALILTGMGDDGAAGLASVHSAGGFVVAQDEATSVVFGMPGAACAAGIVDMVRPLDALPNVLLHLVRDHMA